MGNKGLHFMFNGINYHISNEDCIVLNAKGLGERIIYEISKGNK